MVQGRGIVDPLACGWRTSHAASQAARVAPQIGVDLCPNGGCTDITERVVKSLGFWRAGGSNGPVYVAVSYPHCKQDPSDPALVDPVDPTWSDPDHPDPDEFGHPWFMPGTPNGSGSCIWNDLQLP